MEVVGPPELVAAFGAVAARYGAAHEGGVVEIVS